MNRAQHKLAGGMNFPGRLALLVFLGWSLLSARGATNLSVWAYPGPSGRMIRQPDAQGNRVLDYSGVGYKGGGVAIPNIIAKTNLSAVAGDNGARIQAALNYVSGLPLDANGFRGAVQLAPGFYPVSNTLVIAASGVVLRGAGEGGNTNDNTVLYATYVGTAQPSLILFSNSSVYTSLATHTITNVYVPAGARSFNVDGASGFSAGTTVFVHRPSTSLWITNLGMNLVTPAWTAGSFDIYPDRTITRIEGNAVTLDAPLTCAVEQQYGGGTIFSYAWPGRMTNVGVENLRGISCFNPLVVTNTSAAANYPSDENHAWELVSFEGAIANGWARNITASNFAYACVSLSGTSASKPGVRNITVRDCTSLDPVSEITGGRRYAFVMNDSQFCLVQNCYTRNDRHQFVMQSLTVGPNVFVDGLSDIPWSEAGPHFRWATGAIWDGITVNGDYLAVRNRGNQGTSHGWAGANDVVWNSKADGLIVENPPTARNWLIGSVGSLVNNSYAIPYPAPAGTYDSLGTNVFPNSLYYAQLQDRLADPNLETREYWAGDLDQFVTASPTGDAANVDSAWRSSVQAAAGGAAVNGFDFVGTNQWIPFTFNFSLSATDQIVGATLALALRSVSGTASNAALYLDSLASSNRFSSLGWTPIRSGTNTTVRVLDLGDQLNLLTNGILNVAVAGDVGIDWAMLEFQVAPVQTLYTNSILPVADAYVRGGTSSVLNFGSGTTLDIKGDPLANNQRQAYLRWNLAGYSATVLQARIRLTPVSVGTNGVENGLTLVTNNNWSESTVNWTNQPGGGKRFATWIPAANVPIEVVVTPQVQAALAADGQLSLELFSLATNSASGLVSYAARGNADAAYQPQLLLLYSNTVPAFSGLTNASIIYGATNVILSGLLNGTNGGTPVYPASGETVSASINGRTVNGTVTNTAGRFSINYSDASLATNGVSGSPCTISYSYGGNNASLTAAGNDTSTTLAVTPAPVTILAGLSANPKAYDGTATATISSNGVVLSGVITADANFVGLSTSGYAATFNDASVGSNKPVAISGLSLTGTRATHYTLIQPTHLTASISNAYSLPLLSIFVSHTNKVYGQTLTFAGTEFTTTGLTNGDTVASVTLASSGAMNTADAGSYSIAATNAVGSGLGNYAITYVSGTLTVAQAVTAFSNLTPSQAIPVGTANRVLTGNVAAAGPIYPTNGAPVNVTINGSTQTANVTNGSFSVLLNTAGIPAAGAAYTLTYAYAGNINFVGNTNSSTTLAVYNPTNLFVWTGASGTDLSWSTFGNWSPVGVPGNSSTVLFTNAGTATSATASNNVVTASVTVKSLAYSQTNNIHHTFINPGATLTVSNPAATNLFFIGTDADLGKDAQLTNTLSGAGGALVILSTNPYSALVIRQASATAGLHNASLDMSGLDNFNCRVGSIQIGVQGPINRAAGTWLLAKTNAIVLSGAGTALDIGDLGGNGGRGILQLGYTNAVSVDAIKVAGQKSSGILQFNPDVTNRNPVFYLRGNTNARVALFALGDNSTTSGSGSASTGTVDLSGGTLDAQVDALYVGRSQSAPSGLGVATGTWTFTRGTLNVNTLEVAYQVAGTNLVTVFGTVNVSGSASLVVNASLRLGRPTAATNQPVAVLNISGGTVQANQVVTESTNTTITITSGTLLASNTIGTAAAPLGTLNLSGSMLQLAPVTGSTNVSVKTLTTASATSNWICITALPSITNYPVQFRLIKYATFNSNANFSLGPLPTANSLSYQGYLSNNVAGGSIDLVIVTNGPPPVVEPQFTFVGMGGDGSFNVSGTGPTNASYRILAATNLGLPFSSWTPMVTGVFNGGIFNFTDVLATNFPARFYRAVTP